MQIDGEGSNSSLAYCLQGHGCGATSSYAAKRTGREVSVQSLDANMQGRTQHSLVCRHENAQQRLKISCFSGWYGGGSALVGMSGESFGRCRGEGSPGIWPIWLGIDKDPPSVTSVWQAEINSSTCNSFPIFSAPFPSLAFTHLAKLSAAKWLGNVAFGKEQQSRVSRTTKLSWPPRLLLQKNILPYARESSSSQI